MFCPVQSIATMFLTIFNNYTLVYRDFLYFRLDNFKSFLLQICCMWERVNPFMEYEWRKTERRWSLIGMNNNETNIRMHAFCIDSLRRSFLTELQ